MKKKTTIPSIHIPIQTPSGSMEWVWYLFLQYLDEKDVDLSNYYTKEEADELLDKKVDKTDQANKIYGTDEDGNQTTYDKPTIPTVGNGTITITQGGETKGSFTTNQDDNATIDLDAGGNDGYHPDLFDWKWADHQLNDVQWLRADTFSWQDGGVYEAAYQHLADDISGKSLSSETIAGVTVQFYLADDGHKICPDLQENNVVSIYNATGVAWYYIIDTTNQRFKLPRTKFGITGFRDTVGKYVEAGLPPASVTNIIGVKNNVVASGGFSVTDTGGAAYTGGGSADTNVDKYTVALNQDAYGNSDTVQPPATQMYLYFYVGNFTQSALENTAGLNTELFNNKADKDFGNTTMIDYVVEKQDPSAGNNYTWYRKYADGWVEQGGYVVLSGNTSNSTMNLPVTMSDTNYIVELTKLVNQNFDQSVYAPHVRVQNTTNFTYSYNTDAANSRLFWQVSGIAA